MAYGIWHMAYGIWHMAYGIWHMAYGIWHMAYGIWHVAYGQGIFYFVCSIILSVGMLQTAVYPQIFLIFSLYGNAEECSVITDR
jgi:hypothetical protein